MAGEVFIARQDTLEAVKGTVDGIDSGVKQTNNALGNFSGGGTDTVKTELETLKNNMAQLQTKSEQLESKVDQLLSKGGGFDPFNELVWADKINLAQLNTGKQYKIFYVPKSYESDGKLNLNISVNNSDGGNCKVFINDYMVYEKTGTFNYVISMPLVEFTLRIEHAYRDFVALRHDDVNLFWKEIK